jgi:hypothetical protein
LINLLRTFTFAPMRRKKKEAMRALELYIKTSVFFLILLTIAFQQEAQELSNNITHISHPELKLIAGFKSFITAFNNIVSYFKGVY